ncbi:MAG: response regulator transcription factor [Clostridia bacterium]|nr:response regulator transcription factor [Clostridia bacterium]
MINILIVEDDAELNKTLCSYLNNTGFKATGCLGAEDAYDAMYNNLFELIISDIMMPGIDGFEFARTVREVNKSIPILFMSAKDDLPSKQKGFRLGIDDYMVKPVDFDELLLRVRALLRRANVEMERKISVGNLTMDADAMTATLYTQLDKGEKSEILYGNEIPVTTREFNILYKLLSYPNKTFSRGQLMDEFWGRDSDTSLRAVDVYVTKLRDKFSACDGFKIVTVRGLGYKSVIEKVG